MLLILLFRHEEEEEERSRSAEIVVCASASRFTCVTGTPADADVAEAQWQFSAANRLYTGLKPVDTNRCVCKEPQTRERRKRTLVTDNNLTDRLQRNHRNLISEIGTARKASPPPPASSHPCTDYPPSVPR
ncbi:hypothetical protein AVEN_190360-1 [Araneus ventricosus]|uniref:Uncharacterized protein n=1 Tax=Araneus ventricosus TaxID=182803 RepID=A0A4Y2GSH0_ARAVE|nr:hypothetical protein AVEN_190360-1 [Araneus ventricosus]